MLLRRAYSRPRSEQIAPAHITSASSGWLARDVFAVSLLQPNGTSYALAVSAGLKKGSDKQKMASGSQDQS